MGYGGGILGGLGAFAGGLSKGWDEREEQEWQRKVRSRQEKEWSDEDELKARLAAGPKVGDVTSGSKVATQGYDSRDAANAAVQAALANAPLTIADSPVVAPVKVDTDQFVRGLPSLPPAPRQKAVARPTAPVATPPSRSPAVTPAAVPPTVTPPAAVPGPQVAQRDPNDTEKYLAGGNDFGVNLNKAAVFYDPLSKQWRVTDEDSAHKATQFDVDMHQAAVYAAAGPRYVTQAAALRQSAYQTFDAERKRNSEVALDTFNEQVTKGGSLNDALSAVSQLKTGDGNRVLLGAHFSVQNQPDGSSILMVSPDGMNPAHPVPGVQPGTEAQLASQVRALLADPTGAALSGIQKSIFDEKTALQTLAIQQGHLDVAKGQLAETVRSNKVSEGQRNAQIAISRARGGGAGGGAVGGTAINRKDLGRFDGLTRTLMQGGNLTMEQAQAQAFSKMPAAFQQAYASEYGGIYDPRQGGGNGGAGSGNGGAGSGNGGAGGGSKPTSAAQGGSWNPLSAVFGPATKPQAQPKLSEPQVQSLARTAQGNIRSYDRLSGWTTPGMTLVGRAGDTRRSINDAVAAARNSGLPQYQKKPNEGFDDYDLRLRRQLGLPRQW